MGKLTQQQIRDAYAAWINVRNRIDDSSRAVIEDIAERVQYAPVEQPVPSSLVERMLEAFSQHRHKARQIDGMAAALRVVLDEALGPVTDEEFAEWPRMPRPTNCWDDLTYKERAGVLLKHRRSRLLPPAAPVDPAVEAIQAAHETFILARLQQALEVLTKDMVKA